MTSKKTPRDWDGCYCICELDMSKADKVIKDTNSHRSQIKREYHGDVFAEDCFEKNSMLPFIEFFQQIRGMEQKKESFF